MSSKAVYPDLTQRFDKSFFEHDTATVAKKLIGSYLVSSDSAGNITAGMIVENEAYCGPDDKGAHTFGGKPTPRTKAMFGPKGHAYIYLIYGMYWCVNVVAGPVDKPQAVLLRALEPVLGLDIMRERLSAQENAADYTLCRGPGKLCKALGLDKEVYGVDMTGDRFFIVPGKNFTEDDIGSSPRINIDYAEDWIDRPLRFYLRNNKSVSGPARLRR